MFALAVIPLTILPLIVFNIVGWIFGHDVWSTVLVNITMVSGVPWSFSLGDLLILFGIGCLFFEILKSTASTSREIANHILSTVVFVIYLIEFIVVGIAAHSVFFLLMIISLFDVIAGFTISIKTASRDIQLGRDVQ